MLKASIHMNQYSICVVYCLENNKNIEKIEKMIDYLQSKQSEIEIIRDNHYDSDGGLFVAPYLKHYNFPASC